MKLFKLLLYWVLILLGSISILLGLLLVVGCEPYGGGYGYQYMGKVKGIQFKSVTLDNHTKYTTTVTVHTDVFVVEGKVGIPGLQNAYVWANRSTKTLRLRGLNRMSAEHPILSAESRYLETINRSIPSESNPHHYSRRGCQKREMKSSDPYWYSGE